MQGRQLRILQAIVCLFASAQALHQSGLKANKSIDIKERQPIYSCSGKKVVFPWNLESTQGQRILFIRWLFHGPFSTETIATLANRDFQPTVEYGQRIERVGQAGMALGPVSVSDSGNYSMQWMGLDGRGTLVNASLPHMVLQVSDKLLAEGGEIRLSQRPVAIRRDGGQLSVALECGHFQYISHPPFPVHWTTPSGDVIEHSHEFKDGNYVLLLENPVKGGNYTCEVPRPFWSDVCVSEDHHSTLKATITLDETQVRLSLLEAQLTNVLRELNQGPNPSPGDLTDSHSTNDTDQINLVQALTALNSKQQQLEQQIENKTDQVETLKSKQQQLEQQIENKTDEVETLKSKQQQLEQQMENKTDEVETLKSRLEHLENNVVKKLEELGLLDSRQTELEINLTKKTEDLERLNFRQTELEHNLAEKSTEVEFWKSRQTDLEGKLTQKTEDVEKLNSSISALKQRLTQKTEELEEWKSRQVSLDNRLSRNTEAVDKWKTEQTELEQKLTHKTDLLSSQMEKNRPVIGFNALATSNQELSQPSHVLFPRVLHNHGNGFDVTTGHFIAPVNGTYFFYFHTKPKASRYGSVRLMANQRTICYASLYDEDSGSCGAVVPLRAGMPVWVQVWGSNLSFMYSSTSFSGVLIG